MSFYSVDSILQCGSSSQSIYIQADGTSTCEKLDDECWNRKYEILIPKKICEVKSQQKNVGIVPLVFAVHGYGGSPSNMLAWEEVAEDFAFVLIRPEGYRRSWNAKYCCGEALAKTVNDYQFFKQTIAFLHESLDFVHKDVVYGIGWSNGGFMVTYAAELFRSIVPYAGYQYHLEDIDFNKYYKEGVGSSSADEKESFLLTGLFQHHSLNDRVVRYNGCCKDESCCCGITADQCISAEHNFDEWGKRINQCDNDSPIIDQRDDMKGFTCHTMINCHANTTLCVYDHNGHFHDGFPMKEEVGHFLSADMCSLSTSVWSRFEMTCKCMNYESTKLFCLQLANDDRSLLELRKQVVAKQVHSSEAIQNANDGNQLIDHTFFGKIIMILVFAGSITMIFRKRMIRKFNQVRGWEKVGMSENEIELSSTL